MIQENLFEFPNFRFLLHSITNDSTTQDEMIIFFDE